MNASKGLPPVHGPVLERERLMARLLAWEDKKLVILHGQAGQGKSTLAAEYARSRSAPTVWYTLDREDADPLVFLTGLGRSVERVHPGPLPRLPFARYGAAVSGRSVSGWISGAFGAISGPLLIVLDDCPDLSSPSPLRPVLKMLIDSTPASVRILVLSRSRPDLEIAGLRARQAVGELTGSDLRFTDEETYHLFTGLFGMQINQRDTEAINRLAEGWPAGLVLMREYLAAAPRAVSSLLTERHRHPGITRHVFEYLAQEVFTHLSPGLQRFLLRTSIVDYLTPDLMELLSGLSPPDRGGRVQAADMVEELRTRNLFLTSTDDGRLIVRYHALFREFLTKKLSSTVRPSELKRLYAAAARYFRQQGDRVRAIDLTLASRDFGRAVDLMERYGQKLIAAGRTQTLLRWMEELPSGSGDRPWFLFFKAVSRRFTDPQSALALFDRALAGFRKDRNARRRIEGRMFSLCGIIEACFYSGGNFKRMAEAAARAGVLLSRTSAGTAEARSRLLLALGTAYFFIGKLTEGADALSRARELFRKRGDHFSQIQCAYLAPCSLYLGNFNRAREAVRKGFEALKQVPEEKGSEAALSIAQAMIALFEGSFDESQECIDRCRSLVREYGLEAFDFLSLDIGGWLKMARGEHNEAERLLRQCKEKARELKNDFFSASAAHLLSVNYLHQNKLRNARSEADFALAVRRRAGSKIFHAVSLSASGAINMKLGRLSRARRELLHALGVFNDIGAAQQQANVHLALSKLSLMQGNAADARRHLHAGFRIGQELGFTYYYLLDPDGLTELAERAIEEDICVDHCSALIREHLRARTSPRVRIHTLGDFRVERGRHAIGDREWKSSRAKALVKLLAAQGGRKLSRETAMDVLWPEGKATQQGFTSLLHRVRKALSDSTARDPRSSPVLLEDDRLALNSVTVWTDAAEFLANVEKAERMKTAKDPEAALKYYGKAFELYAGDFLPEDLYDGWVLPARERFRSLYLAALEDSAKITEQRGTKGGALVYYEKLFFADPCNERSCRWLMSHHLAAGRRTDAVRIFERCELAMEKELEAEPGGETRRLYRSIIGG